MKLSVTCCFLHIHRRISCYFLLSVFLLALLYTSLVLLYYKHNRIFHITPLLITGIVGTILIISVPVLWRRHAMVQSSKTNRCCKFVIEVIMLTTIGMFLSVVVSSFNSLWCCIRHDDVINLCNSAIAVTQLLDQSKILYFLCYGSALAVYRNRGAQLPHEHDIDICILKKDEEKVNQALLQSGMEFVSNYKTNPGFILSFRVYPFEKGTFGLSRVRHKWIMLWVDIYSYHVVGNKWRWKNRNVGGLPKEMIQPLQSASFCGHPVFKVPRWLPSYLQATYGSNYRTPQFAGRFKKFSCNWWYDNYGL